MADDERALRQNNEKGPNKCFLSSDSTCPLTQSGQENGPKAEFVFYQRIRQKERQDKAEEQEGIEKWDQNDSPEVPDRGRHHNLRPPFNGVKSASLFRT